jgi:hypothetical protein
MSFAFPSALILTAFMLPIIALYIMKVRLRRIAVSTNLFWKELFHETPPRSLWQYFRNLVSLLLQLLLLLLIVFGAADPYFTSQLLQARRIVLVVDNSASMRADDIKPTRLEAAKEAASAFIDGMRFRDEAAIVLAGHAPDVIIGMTGHSPTLKAGISGISFSDSPSHLKSAIDLGRQLVGNHPHGQVIVLSDGCISEWNPEDPNPVVPSETEAQTTESGRSTDDTRLSESVPEVNQVDVSDAATTSAPPKDSAADKPVPIALRLFGTEAVNIGITQLQVRRSFADPLGYEVLVSVRNATPSTVTCRLELTLNDIPIDVIPLTLQPEQLWTRSLEKTTLEGGTVKGELTRIEIEGTPSQDKHDYLPSDNSAWALLPERKVQPVLLITPGNLFLQKVFEANPLVEVTVAKKLPPADQIPQNTLIVLHGEVPATLPQGQVFIVDPVGNCDLWEQEAPVNDLLVTEQDQASPLMTHVRLDNVLIAESRQLRFHAEPHVLAKTLSGEVIYAAIDRPSGKCLVLTVNLDRSDLAFRTVFPVMVANALAWYSGTAGELQQSVSTGAVARLRLPDDQSPKTGIETWLKSPTGLISKAVVTQQANGSANITTKPLNEVGIWSAVRRSSRSHDESTTDHVPDDDVLTDVAVNLSDERETDLRPRKDLVKLAETFQSGSGSYRRPLWVYLVLCAGALTLIEWWLYHRRVIT